MSEEGARVACLLPAGGGGDSAVHHGALADLTTCPARGVLPVPPGVRLLDAAAVLPGGWPALWVRRQPPRPPDFAFPARAAVCVPTTPLNGDRTLAYFPLLPLPSQALRQLGVASDRLPESPDGSLTPAAAASAGPAVVVLAGLSAATAAALRLCLSGAAAGVAGGSVRVILVGGPGRRAWPVDEEGDDNAGELFSSREGSAAAGGGGSPSPVLLGWCPSALQDAANSLRRAPPPPGSSGDERLPGNCSAAGGGAPAAADALLLQPRGGGSGPPADYPVGERSPGLAADDLVAEHEGIADKVLELTVRTRRAPAVHPQQHPPGSPPRHLPPDDIPAPPQGGRGAHAWLEASSLRRALSAPRALAAGGSVGVLPTAADDVPGPQRRPASAAGAARARGMEGEGNPLDSGEDAEISAGGGGGAAAAGAALEMLAGRSGRLAFLDLSRVLHAARRPAAAAAVEVARRAGEDVLRLLAGGKEDRPWGGEWMRAVATADSLGPEEVAGALRQLYPRTASAGGAGGGGPDEGEEAAALALVVAVVKVQAAGDDA